MEIMSLFSMPALRVRIEEYFKDEIWYIKKGSDINSAECSALVNYIEKQAEMYMRNVIGLLPEYEYEVAKIGVVTSWEECNNHFIWNMPDGNVVAQGVMSLEVPNNLCKLRTYCFSGMREDIEELKTSQTVWYRTSEVIPMAENELIIVPGAYNPDIEGLNEPGMFVVFNIKTK
jgi:hypothetical protein